MTVRYTDIQASNWQSKLGTPGQVVTDADDIQQCITIICSTPKGAMPMQPDFGDDTFDYIDRPLNEAAPHIIRSTFEAIAAWEPRAIVESVTPSLVGDSNVERTIVWHPADAPDSQQVTTVDVRKSA